VCGSQVGRCARAFRARWLANDNWGVLIGLAPDRQGRAALHLLSQRYANFINPEQPPSNIASFGTGVNFPLLLGIVLAVLGAATFVHLLVVTVARRRRDFGLLKALGFVRAQVAASVSWQATAVALVAVVVGVPLGIAVGRIVWHAFAYDLGAVPLDVVPGWLIAGLAFGVVVGANALAVLPALGAARLRPALALREP